ncbi:FAD/NAD(P)-binding domain-containing protein [Lophiostoma macrostomum CBS 122681]|uniref:FAD/NAD(P)-binding domain-containing protein n=1 Tax=Lophiostoma macrostomum CBS 122681 TaxID=1314788 RepID=A0A6A6SQW6_9PLEO|nr:FAD/NAD(P)-binding domain-containing protein [Lophiostoma macrostomum CBS 122681]
MAQLPQKISVAIVGGGIAGLCTAIGLQKHAPHLEFTIYEAAARFDVIGSGVAFGPNALEAFTLIDPALREAFDRISTTNQLETKKDTWFEFRWGQDMEYKNGKAKTGDLISAVQCHEGQATVHRARFLEVMLPLIPHDSVKFRKRLAYIKNVGDAEKTRLVFKDGTEALHDVVIGSDGIKSHVREFVDHKSKPGFSTKYCHRGVIPMEKAIAVMGEERAGTNTGYLGKHGHIISFPVDQGDAVSVTLFKGERIWTAENWVVETTREHIAQDYKDWGAFVHELIPLMQDTSIWAVFELVDNPPSTYVRGNVCITGDAAHASAPHQGSGAGMAIEDSYVLSALLTDVKDTKDISRALRAYDAVRRPRTRRFQTSSRDAGLFWEFEHPDFGVDVDKMKPIMQERMEWIWYVDLQKEVEMAKDLLETF